MRSSRSRSRSPSQSCHDNPNGHDNQMVKQNSLSHIKDSLLPLIFFGCLALLLTVPFAPFFSILFLFVLLVFCWISLLLVLLEGKIGKKTWERYFLSICVVVILILSFVYSVGIITRFAYFFRGERHKAETGTYDTFENMTKHHPEWKKENGAFISIPEDGFIYRVQEFGSCYIHAPIAIQFYIASRSITNALVVDMVSLVYQSFDFFQLFNYFFLDTGGYSLSVLDSLLKTPSVIRPSVNITDDLHKYGPLLISSMVIYDDFLHYRFSLRTVNRSGNSYVYGHHSMVIIGCRVEVSTGTTFFLIQNWWKGEQFVEVSEDYLYGCEAFVFRVETPQDIVITKFKTTDQKFAQAFNLDRRCKIPKTY